MRTCILFLKAQSIPPGARWITVRPNGPGTEGHPLLIQPSGDGAFRVIGGAGGKLNYLKLTGVRSEAEYAQRQRESAKARREARMQQAKRDREAGISGEKQKARDQLRLAAQAARAEFVAKVSEALGWQPDDTRFRPEDHQDKPPAEVDRLQTEHFNRLFDAAKAAVEAQRGRLLADADMRAEAGLSSVPLDPPDDPQQISVADLAPGGDTLAERGLGFRPDYEKRATEAGATPEDIQAEAQEVQPPRKPLAPPADAQPGLPGTPAPEAAAAPAPGKKKSTGERIADATAEVREPVGPRVDPKGRASAKAAMAVLKAQRDLKAKLKEVRARAKEVEKAATADEVQPQAFVIEVEGKPAADEDVARGLEEELRTIRTRGFLDEVQRQGAQDVPRHVGIGAYNAVNGLALTAGGAALLDRSVVDVLGPAGAAQALVARLHADLTPDEMADLKQAMADYHVDHYMRRSEEAMADAKAMQEEAAEIALGEAGDGHDLALAQELNHRRRELVARSKAILAQALGEMETNAAIVAAMEKPDRDRITVPLGEMDAASAIVRLRAIGLERGDYTLERAGRNTIAVIGKGGIPKLSQPVAREEVARTNEALRIMAGERDEAGWLPAGVARRTRFGEDVPQGVAPRLARPFPQAPKDVGQAVRDYIAGRAADGDAPADIMAGLLSEETIQKAGDRDAFMAAVNEVAPLYDAEGKMIRADAHREAFEAMADAWTQREFGTQRAPIHRQQVAEDATTVEAMHRALARTPEAAAAFKPVGDLSPEERRGLREFFGREFGQKDAQAAEKRARVEALDQQEPEKEVDDFFGRGTNPEWTRWKAERDEAAAAANSAELGWDRYVEAHGSREAAYQAIQDVVRGRAVRDFAAEHNKLRPEAPIRVGRTGIRGDLAHADVLDPAARERRAQMNREMVDRLRNRVAGRYAQGSVADKMAAAREAEEAASQAQMGLFGDEPAADEAGTIPEDTRPLDHGERWTVGAAAERTLAGVVGRTGGMWKPGQPVNLYAPAMDGKFAARQRAVKLLEHNKRLVAGLGVGSGKTGIMLGGFTHLKEKGKAKRGLFLVPSVVQGQFHGEALAMLEPGRYSWHANPGAARDERIAALKDDSGHDFAVMTHQGFRDDVVHLAAKHAGVTEEAMADRLAAMTPEDRHRAIKDTLAREGIGFDYLAVDEGHNLLNRKGKEDSRMAGIVDAVSKDMGHYILASADPVKNDWSEAFDTLAKMDPDRYRDRAAFQRRYGVDTLAAKDGLRRELARHYYTQSIPSGVNARRTQVPVELHPQDRARVEAVTRAAGAARLAKLEGRVDVGAMRELSPGSFDGVPPEKHEEVAGRLQDAIGVIRDGALLRAVSGRGKQDALSRIAAERKGKPGVVFARHLDQVEALAARLKAEGHRVVTMTGKHGAKEKDRIKREFQRGDHDTLIVSDAGAVGANLQRASYLVQVDTPSTAMAQPLDAKILTPSGWRTMGEMRPGDEVTTPTGEVAKVVGVYPQGEKPVFRVTFSDGSSTRCCDDHLWLTQSRDDVKKKRGWRVRDLAHLRRTLWHADQGRQRPNYTIPLVGRLDFQTDSLAIPPYLLGCILGDGEFGRHHVSLAAIDEEIIGRAGQDAARMGARVSQVGPIQYRLVGDGTMEGFPAKRHSPVLHAARALGFEGGRGATKRVPPAYLFGRFEDRLALLQGLMDTDGTVDRRNGHSSFCTTSTDLRDAVVHLAQSLGGAASFGTGKQSYYRGKCGKTHWKVSVQLPLGLNPFHLRRKAEVVERRAKRLQMRRAIVSAEPCGVEPVQCILVDHPSHLYVTDCFIVTHNTHAQRNGRIDRIGQKNDVELLDLVADHPVERQARDRLARKYGLREVVTSPLDGLDDSGLAGFLHRARLARTGGEPPAPAQDDGQRAMF